jgi:pimeloyl-ACP methyl ester carboxylesterase
MQQSKSTATASEDTTAPQQPTVYLKRLLFLHANGYPAAVYRRFLESLALKTEVIPIAILQTPVATPAALRWRRMREQVIEQLTALTAGDTGSSDTTGLVGHSMGGYLALLAASHRLPARHPVVLIDSPIPALGRGALLSLAQRTGLVYRVGPATVAARRRNTWPDLDEARGFFAGKAFVQRWAPGVLDDFVAHALRDSAGSRGGNITLRIPREEERDIYAHLPHRDAGRSLQRLRAAGLPVGMVAGRQSAEMRMAGWQANRRLFRGRLVTLDAGHLVPLERPKECAEAVMALLTPGGTLSGACAAEGGPRVGS